ncbi:D-hexose-6-phosphate mutarotase [Massilia sp. TWP1-3-3]|uniref:D-hexose-6-phosphate mutarotase n=1 Tax=Massilia sp. TWP1-3-3 TaxID=2804573 RepID=UPI003CF1A11B
MNAITMTTWGALPAVQLTSADGACAIVTLYGAHLVSWTSADGADKLFCSERSARDGSRAIRGGVPVIFPQFAERGDGMRHGFARVSTWRLADSGEGEHGIFAVFVLTRPDLTPAIAAAWEHGFELRLTVALQGPTLNLSLDVRNTGDDEFAFSAALHTYFLVDAIEAVRIKGVEAGALRITDKLDRIYRDATAGITLAHGAGTLRLTQSGFRDAVIWNPGAADTAALADMDDADYRRFVCIEPALIVPASLPAGAAWRGEHQVIASSEG